jgi:thymidylate kinase
VIIEFIGLPGGGKSTCAGGLRSLLEGRGWTIIERVELLQKYGARGNLIKFIVICLSSFCGPDRSAVVLLFRYVWSIKGASSRRWLYFPAMLRMVVATRRGIRLASPSLQLWDQGLLQMLWAVIIHGVTSPEDEVHASESILNELLNAVYGGISLTVFYVKITPDEALRRLSLRAGNDLLFPHLSEGERAEVFRWYGEFWGTIFNAVERLGGRVILVNGDASKECVTAEIQSYINKGLCI